MDSKKQIKNVSSSEKTIRKGRRVDKAAPLRKHAAEDGDNQLKKIAGEKHESLTLVKIRLLIFKSLLTISEEE